jgi:hypothetical protein
MSLKIALATRKHFLSLAIDQILYRSLYYPDSEIHYGPAQFRKAI